MAGDRAHVAGIRGWGAFLISSQQEQQHHNIQVSNFRTCFCKE
jgi:hypothetical protein